MVAFLSNSFLYNLQTEMPQQVWAIEAYFVLISTQSCSSLACAMSALSQYILPFTYSYSSIKPAILEIATSFYRYSTPHHMCQLILNTERVVHKLWFNYTHPNVLPESQSVLYYSLGKDLVYPTTYANL